ncbi:Zinc finger, RING/FYVE/PHD-type [Artemisia annua]|uniref:Zinc finger, RING/FYVE/PHD-type n=1 Tax=Artemisia annua TaxID=35608 RepID=A0A2U1Q513_ARTAN|nr:Zinc finger, RING/FYVE/PHD-type [Artemisia annua]
MNIRKKSHCPLCRHPYQHFPAICQTLHFLLKKLYPVSYDRRNIQTQEDEKHNTFGSSPDIDSLITSETNSVGQSSDQSCKQVAISDVTCAACKQLFYRPIVLNCGHVYCESCITIPTEGMLKCQVCECRHPSGPPKVCNELDHFLEEHFSSEYALRSNTIQLNQDQTQKENLPNESRTTQVPGPSFPTEENFLQLQLVHGFHHVGCDMCGNCLCSGRLAMLEGIELQKNCDVLYKPIVLGRKLSQQDYKSVISVANVVITECYYGLRYCGFSLWTCIMLLVLPKDEKHSTLGSSLDIDSLVISEENNVSQSSDISSEDASCVACKQLLFRPIVLNCGHVFCEACGTIPTEWVLKCQVCELRHPSGVPKVCTELDHFLEEQYSSEYALRRSSIQLNLEQTQISNSPNDAATEVPRLSFPTEANFPQWWVVHGSKYHDGVGCDMCGMYPIIRERYMCKYSTEKCGYDLCGDCYNAGSSLPGRFKQKHTSTHHLELVKAVINRNVIYRLLSGHLAAVASISS